MRYHVGLLVIKAEGQHMDLLPIILQRFESFLVIKSSIDHLSAEIVHVHLLISQ